jgi:hypothetical protein
MPTYMSINGSTFSRITPPFRPGLAYAGSYARRPFGLCGKQAVRPGLPGAANKTKGRTIYRMNGGEPTATYIEKGLLLLGNRPSGAASLSPSWVYR